MCKQIVWVVADESSLIGKVVEGGNEFKKGNLWRNLIASVRNVTALNLSVVIVINYKALNYSFGYYGNHSSINKENLGLWFSRLMR